jgi:hypothetical protein
MNVGECRRIKSALNLHALDQRALYRSGTNMRDGAAVLFKLYLSSLPSLNILE